MEATEGPVSRKFRQLLVPKSGFLCVSHAFEIFEFAALKLQKIEITRDRAENVLGFALGTVLLFLEINCSRVR